MKPTQRTISLLYSVLFLITSSVTVRYGKMAIYNQWRLMKNTWSLSCLPQVRTLFVSGLPLDIKPRELYLLFRPFKVCLYVLNGWAAAILSSFFFPAVNGTSINGDEINGNGNSREVQVSVFLKPRFNHILSHRKLMCVCVCVCVMEKWLTADNRKTQLFASAQKTSLCHRVLEFSSGECMQMWQAFWTIALQ